MQIVFKKQLLCGGEQGTPQKTTSRVVADNTYRSGLQPTPPGSLASVKETPDSQLGEVRGVNVKPRQRRSSKTTSSWFAFAIPNCSIVHEIMILQEEAERTKQESIVAIGSPSSDCITKVREEVVLPGYDAGIDESGVQHSQDKLKGSADRLFATLTSISSSQQVKDSDDERKVVVNSDQLHRSSIIGGLTKDCIQTFYCENEEETLTYRCRCNFQIVLVEYEGATCYRYAMRSMGKPVLLGTKNSFPIATNRIQSAMDDLMEHLNSSDGTVIGQNGHLTSCTFSSAWNDTPDADCILTLHYDQPLDPDENTKTIWIQQADILCHKMRLRQINGRSKGTLLSVGGNDSTNADGKEGATIRDTIFLLRNACEDTRNEWKVSLDSSTQSTASAISVHYDKPETAFYHPNANAMKKALSWMLNRLDCIASSSSNQKLNMLEMYCGCGAHTVALGRSGLVSKIIAVELDPRLVSACKANIAKNSLQELVEVRRGDAGRWAKEESRKRRSRKMRASSGDDTAPSNQDNYYDVLLVDPPRQGLDEEVCKMAMMSMDGKIGSGESCFRNLLYVSCGHKALLRDLERLSPFYEVENCAQMDLFPRTDSIETLVHLKRRQSTEKK